MVDPDIDVTTPHPARVYNVFLGGKDNYPPDRAAAEAMMTMLPAIPTMARANRAFLGRAVRHLVADHGVRQFLDIGCGLPAVDPVHAVAGTIEPGTRVVYVDNDPLVLAHARALLAGSEPGQVTVIPGDARHPDELLAQPAVVALDHSAPIAVMLVSVLMYFTDEEVARLIDSLVTRMPSGSYVTISHPTLEFDSTGAAADAVAAGKRTGIHYIPRDHVELESLLGGLEILDPGIVPLLSWRPAVTDPDPHHVFYWAAMARIP